MKSMSLFVKNQDLPQLFEQLQTRNLSHKFLYVIMFQFFGGKRYV